MKSCSFYLLAILVVSGSLGATTSLEKVIVTADAEELEARKQGHVKKIVIGEAEVEKFGDATVGDVLRRLPGMSFTGPAGVSKDVRIRGLDKGYTQFLINGEPAPAIAQDRQMQVDRLPADMIERIEVLHNPSAEYDAGGIGGTINIILKSRVEELTRLRVSGGVNGDLNVGDVIGQWSRSFETVDVLLSVSHTVGAEDVDESKSTFNGSTGVLTSAEKKHKPVEKSETLFAPQLTWNISENGKWKFEPFVSNGSEEKTEDVLVFNAVGSLTKKSWSYEDKDDRILRLLTRYEHKTDWGQWNVKAGSQEGSQDKIKTIVERTAVDVINKRAEEVEELEDAMDYVGAGVTIDFSQHRLKAGVEYRDTDYLKTKTTAEAKNATDPLLAKAPGANDIYQIAEEKNIVFLQDEWRLASSHWLTAGVRYEGVDRFAEDRTGAFRRSDNSSFNPSIHYRWAITGDINFRASLAQTLRLPKFDWVNPLVTTATGANAGGITNPDKGGNAALDPEKALGAEASIEKYFNNDNSLLSFTLYDREVEDYIEKSVRLEEGRYVERPYNAGNAEFWGAEWELMHSVLQATNHHLDVKIGHSELHGRINNKSGADAEIKDMPPRMTNLGIDWTYKPMRLISGASINYTPAYDRTSINDDAVMENKTRNEAILLDLYLSKSLGDYWDIRLIAKNLLKIEKDETTSKFKADGSVNSLEDKVEESEPVFLLVLDTRF
jgi:outer membrane receptor for ferrienterochelin and colicins